MQLIRILLLGVLAVSHVEPAQAWGARGHRLAAALAEAELAPSTRRAALDLLGAESLAEVATWADALRDEPAFRWTAPLHYVNLPRSCRFEPARDCRDGACIVAAIERYRSQLADAALPREQRADALRFLVHFVADLHQPLHAGFADDRGGNRFQVNFDGEGSNLHSIWDRTLLSHRTGSEAAQLARLQAAPMPRAGTLRASRWATQSCRLIDRHGVYPPQHAIGEDYIERHRPLAESQLKLAAARLAAVIEVALGT